MYMYIYTYSGLLIYKDSIFILSGKSQSSVLSERREVGPGRQAHLDGVWLLSQALSAHSLVPSSTGSCVFRQIYSV